MDDENLGPISLNLDTTASTFYKHKGKEKIHGDRRSRIKQRRNAKQSNLSSDGPTSDAASPVRKKKKVNETSNSESVETKKQHNKVSRPDGIISSLFKKNPEIPTIQSTEVAKVSEDVFTGRTFKDLPIHPYLVANLEEKQGFKEMTRVQQQAIPVLLKGRDALIKSQTGSGKTLAYAVPIIHSLQSYRVQIKRLDGPYALIVVPTRELAIQSYDLFAKLLRTFVWIVPGCLMGGEKRKAEKARLRKGVNILVTTPGRLLDHLRSTNVLSLAKVNWLVIDEADRLLELGYERDVAQILNALKSQCPDPQTVLVSATLSAGVERLSSISLRNPHHVDCRDGPVKPAPHESPAPEAVASAETAPHHPPQAEEADSFSVPSELAQFFIVTPCKLRLVALVGWILWKCKYCNPGSKMIVFLSTQAAVEFHSRLISAVFSPKKSAKSMEELLALNGKGLGETEDVTSNQTLGFDLFQLHGDMKQKERTETFLKFTEAKTGVLLCTDVAARGLDLPLVDWIVQYSLPGALVDYVHRIGRTARAGSRGHSLLFLMPSEVDYLKALNKRQLSLSQIEMSEVLRNILANVDDLPQPDVRRPSRQSPRTEEEAATFLQDRFEEAIVKDKELRRVAAKGFQSYVRAYATYCKEVKDILKVSQLHLGHVAKSFALREAPSNVHNLSDKATAPKWKREKGGRAQSTKPLSFKQAALSEFSSGLQTAGSKGPATDNTNRQWKKADKFKKNKRKKLI